MPLFLVLVAVMLIVAGVRGTYATLGGLLKSDFSGQNNFFVWIAAVGIVGSVGYVPALQTFSRAMLGLVILSMFLANGTGIFDQFAKGIENISPAAGPKQASNSSGGASVGNAAASAAGSAAQSAAGGIGSSIGSFVGSSILGGLNF